MNLLNSLSMSLFRLFEPTPAIDDDLRRALQRIAERLGPVLAAEADFERLLLEPLAHTLAYCKQLVEHLPPARDIDRHAFSADPLVHALFASADDINEMLGLSTALRSYLQQAPQSQSHCHALLAARQMQKSGFGVGVQGDVLVSDIPQRWVYFTAHTLVLPTDDEASLRQRAREAAFDSLIETFVQHVSEARRQQAGLHQHGVSDSAKAANPHPIRRIDALDQRLASMAFEPSLLLEALAEFLRRPEQALRLEPVSLRVSRSGVLIEDGRGDTLNSDCIRFVELEARDRRRHLVLPVRIPLDQARQAIERLRAERDRFMLI